MRSVAGGSTVYEIPCECGRKLTVTAGQAGSQVNCECGNLIDVPTIRELRRDGAPTAVAQQKESVRTDPKSAQDDYSRKALIVTGIVLIVVGLVAFGALFDFQSDLPQEVDPRFLKMIEETKQQVYAQPPAMLFEEWQRVRDKGLGEHRAFKEVVNKDRAQGAMYGAYVGVGASAFGFLLFIFALLLPRRP